MLPVCSAAPSCSSPSLISCNVGSRSISSVRKFTVDDKILSSSFRVDSQESSFKLYSSRSSLLPIDRSIDHDVFANDAHIYPDEFDDIVRGFSNNGKEGLHDKFSYSVRQFDGSCSTSNDVADLASFTMPESELSFNDSYIGELTKDINGENPIANATTPSMDIPSPTDGVLNFQDPLSKPLMKPVYPIPEADSTSNSISSITVDSAFFSSNSSEVTGSIVTDQHGNVVNNLFSDAHQSLDASISKAKYVVEDTFMSFNTFIENTVKSILESFDSGVNGLLSTAGIAEEQTNNKLASFSGEFTQRIYGIGSLAVDTLRHALFFVEDSLSRTTTFVAYSYESAKTMLPPEVQSSLKISEEKAAIILSPVGNAIQKVYILIEAVERSFGVDPNDPITSFVIVLGGSAAFGVSYWIIRYGGYSGDLSPQFTLELLQKDRRTVLIDVRPEDEREENGVPDLRQGARFRYASVTLPEMLGAAKSQLKNVRYINDGLLAVVIRNLQIVNDGSKVIIMDGKGNRSKEIARSLRQLGIKHSYLVEGGFRSWVKDGLRVKELKSETALTILNEEAEAILEDIKPTPSLVFTSGLGLLAVIYALAEWEKTLQLIGFIGIGQSLYRRFASYESSEDFKKDLRLLLTPVMLGAQALSLVAGNSEANKMGLPTIPSSTAVQDRVLQAAAKHESKSSPSDEIASRQFESSSPSAEGEGLDLSEA